MLPISRHKACIKQYINIAKHQLGSKIYCYLIEYLTS